MVRTRADHEITSLADQPPATALGPGDIQDAYDLPTDSGAGQTVAIVDAFGDSHAEADLAAFRDYYGLPPCTTDNGCFTAVNQRGGADLPADGNWDVEISLDLDAVSSACPACHILLVESDDNADANLSAAVDTAVALGAKYVSNSYGVANEYPGQTEFDEHYDHPGVAVTVSSGDAGNVQSWPSTNPHVVSVGGTTLTKDDSTDRGWDETVWGTDQTGTVGGGSGCSLFEPQPDYQTGVDTHCDMRADVDISADADPNTGLAVYNTLSQSGWLQVGGTSLSSPLVAGIYALAGTPVPGTYPVTYPYDPTKTADLNDVTEGSNGSCGNVLCTAGPGWDGPTGMGTPNGVQALTTGPHGDIVGKVTNTDSGAPIAGATVSTPQGYQTKTNKDGEYDLNIPVGSYDVTAAAWGYASQEHTGVQVSEDQTTVDFTLSSVPDRTLSGTVTDGSGHGWPLYAKVTVDGDPDGATYTNPYTGHYSVDLPQQGTYALHVAPVYLPGYDTNDLTVDMGTTDAQRDVALTVDESQPVCTAPGYSWKYDPVGADFFGWTGTTPQDGWTIVNAPDAAGTTWDFDFTGNGGNGVPPIPNGDDDYAEVQHLSGEYDAVDTSLVSPVADMSGVASPVITFDTVFSGRRTSWPGTPGTNTDDVDLSLDGGQTWDTVYTPPEKFISAYGHVEVPIPQAAGQSAVQVRFRWAYPADWPIRPWLRIDNVVVGGPRTCAPLVQGGLVSGVVTDANTGRPVANATVTRDDDPGESTVTGPNRDDPNLPAGFYWLFNNDTGITGLTATAVRYAKSEAEVNVAADAVTRKDLALNAGHLNVTPGAISDSLRMGRSVTKTVTITNDGTASAHVVLGEHDGGLTPAAKPSITTSSGAPLQRIKLNGRLSLNDLLGKHLTAPNEDGAGEASPADVSWKNIADYPYPVYGNAVASHDGKVYSVGGYETRDGGTAAGYVYGPARDRWDPIAPLPKPVYAASAAFVGDTMYLADGWVGADSNTLSSSVYAYHTATDSWSRVADLPTAGGGAQAAVLDGRLYVIGGCTSQEWVYQCRADAQSNLVYRYDVASDSWTRVADYPIGVAFGACAGLVVEIACAGGNDTSTSASRGVKATYVYDARADTWTRGADMPYDDYAMVSGGANGGLQIAGGISDGYLTNQAAEYDPATNTWTALPNANTASYLSGGACGLYQVGGTAGGLIAFPFSQSEVLSGYDQCGRGDVSWLSEDTTELDLAPGESVNVTVTMDSSTVSQPGDYAAQLALYTDTPYRYQPTVTMHVNPPRAWGKVAGTVTDASTGDPIADATVVINASGRGGRDSVDLKTDANGHYQWWLDHRDNPLQVSVAKDGYQPQVKRARIKAGTTTTVNFALRRS